MHDFASPIPPTMPRWLRFLFFGIVGICGVAYFIVLAGHISPYASSSDSSGYFNNARLLGRGEFFTPIRALPGHSATQFGPSAFQPLGFELQPRTERMAPTYPIGLPLHLLAASWFVGWDHAAIAVNLLAVLASGGLFWVIAKRLNLPPIWAGIGVFWLWVCPLFLFSALQPMSDLLALAWSLVVLYGALRARDDWRWGLACGLAMGFAVLVRPTNALLIVPVLVAMGFRWKSLLAIALAGLPGATIFMLYNWRVYGSPFVTGYGDISSVFGPAFVRHNLKHFAYWIPALLSPAVVSALFFAFFPQARNRNYTTLAAWFLSLTGFYTFYYHAGETWWYLRFILPAFPALILLALSSVSAVGQTMRLRPAFTAAVAAGVLLIAAGWEIKKVQQFEIMTLARGEKNYPDAAHWAQKNIPANSAIFCMQVSGAFFYYSDFLLVRWDTIEPAQQDALLGIIAEQKRPVYAALFEFETPRALEKIGGHWTKLTTIGQVTFWQRQS
jgi:hypothetical protein